MVLIKRQQERRRGQITLLHTYKGIHLNTLQRHRESNNLFSNQGQGWNGKDAYFYRDVEIEVLQRAQTKIKLFNNMDGRILSTFLMHLFPFLFKGGGSNLFNLCQENLLMG